ncbi:hypothetical protein N9B24_02985 [bacterium]|nr:hypothetical protein [bacterium]MDB4445682.1 hypothetical protein [bacterium]
MIRSAPVLFYLIPLGMHDHDTAPISIEYAATLDGLHRGGIGNTKQTQCLVRQQINTIRFPGPERSQIGGF